MFWLYQTLIDAICFVYATIRSPIYADLFVIYTGPFRPSPFLKKIKNI